ncbi:MAG: DUF2934 domain-containing protein [Candidatus Omnitrophica bacterium]|nr:DUF2934 domain-containing protein [Candidatus Omnitrophota bacterium]
MEKVKTRFAKRVTDSRVVATKPAAVARPTDKMDITPTTFKRQMTPADFIDRVQCRAYELFEKRGYYNGNDMGDWFEAERIVRAELGI